MARRLSSAPTAELELTTGLAASCAAARHDVTYNRMVVDRAMRTDRLFHALADATRRDIVRRTMRREHSVSALARLYPMSFAAVQKHVAVLESAELVTKERRGREQLVLGNVLAIRDASQQLEELEAVWRHRIDQMDQILAGTEPQGENR
jgi:DNA-binding transcriptional ArsR family regulator